MILSISCSNYSSCQTSRAYPNMCYRPVVTKSACLIHQSSTIKHRGNWKEKSQDSVIEWAAHLACSQITCSRAGNTNSTSYNQCSIDLNLFPGYLAPLHRFTVIVIMQCTKMLQGFTVDQKCNLRTQREPKESV